MARIKVELPREFLYSATIKIRITDLNYGGHVGNDTILGLMHEARMQFFMALGYQNEKDIIEDTGVIMTDAALLYKAETFYGETVLVEIAAEDFNSYGFDFVYKLSSKNSGKEIARGKTGIVCFDYKQRKIAKLPEKLLKQLKQVN